MKYALIVAFMATGFASGWQLRDLRAQHDDAQIQGHFAQQVAISQQRARQREQLLQQKMEGLQHETQQQLAEISAFERLAADARVRELAQAYAAAGAASADSAAANGCQTARTRAAVLAELLAELDQLAAGFALQADRNRISGLACEKAYQAIKFHEKT